MDAVTYPHAQVIEALNQDFVSVQLNTADPDEETKRQMRQWRMLWTPTSIWTDHHGVELRRQVGYLKPEEFLAQLVFVGATAQLLHGQFKGAQEAFQNTADSYPDACVAPEALYYAGVAWLRQGSRDGFRKTWIELKERYPTSTWWDRASFIEG